MSVYRRRIYAPLCSLVVCAGLVLLSVTPTIAASSPAGKAGKTVAGGSRTATAAKSPAKSAPISVKPSVVAKAAPVSRPIVKAAPVSKPVVKAAPVSRPVAKAVPVSRPVAKAAPVSKPVAKAAPTRFTKVVPVPASVAPSRFSSAVPAKAPPAPAPAIVARSGTSRGGARPAPISAPAKTYTIESGIAMHYYQGLMETVARNQGLTMRTDVDGYTSRQNCGEIGSIVEARLLNPRTGQWSQWLRLQVLDCSARSNVAYHRSIGLILEVDYNTAVRTGFYSFGRTEAEVRH